MFNVKPAPSKTSISELIFGPYVNTPALNTEPLYIHYANNKASLVAKTYMKTIEVSHLSAKLIVQEDYELHHMGAKLKGHFNRVEYKLNAHTHDRTGVVKSFNAILPALATDVYFKDVIGNISTSNFRKESKRSVLELRPRYPLYGGWRFTWFHGFQVPTFEYLKWNTHSETFVLSLPFGASVRGLTIDQHTVKIILPEGSR